MSALIFFDEDDEKISEARGDSNRLFVDPSREFRAVQLGNKYSWSIQYNASDNDEVIYVENTDSTLRVLYITKITISAKAKSLFTIQKADGGAGGSTAVDEVNWDSGSVATADVNARRDASGVTGLTPITFARVQDDDATVVRLGGYKLVDTEAIAVTVAKGDEVEVSVEGYFEDV